ncbi:MAG: 8-amino-7-oxononanoate synthase [Rikenellaceae bacterium]
MYKQDIKNTLAELKAKQNLRELKNLRSEGKYVICEGKRYLNFSSNDYLGLSDRELQKEFLDSIDIKNFILSNPSSRLMTGNSPEYQALEGSLENIFPGKRALVLSSGYMVNTGVLAALTSKDDLIIADKLVHASLIDGLKLAPAKFERFAHNDINHLENLLKKSEGKHKNTWVITEDIFSMDGDRAHLDEIISLKEKYNFRIYLDAAHSFGVEDLEQKSTKVDVLVATLGKAIASSGAFVMCSELERNLLINKMRTLIFSTASAPINLMWSKFLVDKIPTFTPRREHLKSLISILSPTKDTTHILPYIVGENNKTIQIADQLKSLGYWVTPIRHPTVAEGTARIRISLSAALSLEDVEKFNEVCKSIF